MDLLKLTGTLLGSDSIDGLSKRTDVSGADVNKVLAAALPALLGGAKEQAKGKETTESFANALSQHAKADTKDLAGFFGNVDLQDGAKIIGHLLGAQKEDVTQSVAEQAGVSGDKTAMILSAAGPLLMSLLGQQADEDDDKESGVGALLGALLENVDLVELLTGKEEETSGKKKTKKKNSKKKSSKKEEESGLNTLMNGLFKLLK